MPPHRRTFVSIKRQAAERVVLTAAVVVAPALLFFATLGSVAFAAQPAGATTASSPRALVTLASASPASLPVTGGTVTVSGTVKHATSCQLRLLSSQSFPVVYSHNPRSCAGGTFSAKVTVGPNPTSAARTVSFALVATNGTSSFAGRFYILLQPTPRALVTSASASPSLVPATGGTVTVSGTVEHATSCQLRLLSSQSFPVVYSHNPRSCAGGTFSAKVTVGPNPTKLRRLVAFALVASNQASSFPGRFYITLAPASAPAPGSGAPPETTTVPSAAPPVSLSVTDSSNWSGYAAMGGPYTEVKGTFTVPGLASGAPQRTQVSQWVGLDGTSQADPSLIQAGVNESPDPQSPTGYDVQPWWEILPAAETNINMTVDAGDKVTVTIWQVSAAAWRINLTDDTNGASFTTPAEAYSGPGKSVEWIVEATTECPTQSSCHTAALAPFTPAVSFSGLGMSGPQATSLDDIVLMQGVEDVATPTPLSAGGFSVSYTGPPPNNF
jgi:hypothetical protein